MKKKAKGVYAMTVILIRLFLVYILLTFTVRFMGKRQIGEMQMSELVAAFMLSELAVMPITDTEIPLLYSILPILLLAVLEILTSFAFLHLPTLSRIVSGVPQVIIRNGCINRRVLKSARMPLTELMGELRLNGYTDPSEIAYAILEENGRLSVIPKEQSQPPRAADLSMQVKERGICHTLIADGVFHEAGIRMASLGAEDIRRYLRNHGNPTPSEVFLLTVNDAKEWNLILKKDCGETE